MGEGSGEGREQEGEIRERRHRDLYLKPSKLFWDFHHNPAPKSFQESRKQMVGLSLGSTLLPNPFSNASQTVRGCVCVCARRAKPQFFGVVSLQAELL